MSSKKSIENNFLNILRQPYPFYYKGKSLLILVSLLFFMTLFFNYFFEPFNVNRGEHRMNYFLISLIHSIVPSIMTCLVAFFYISRKREDNWVVRNEVIFICFVFFLIGVGQFLIRDIIYDNPNNWSFQYFFEEVRNTFLVGILFVLILIPLNYNRLITRNTKNAKKFIPLIKEEKHSKKTVVKIDTQLKNESFELNVDNFLFAKADGNYVEFYIREEKVNKLIKRITIKQLETLLDSFQNIVKTHRAYIVNIDFIKNITGNAQGYKLELEHIDEKIPVSRSLVKHFNTIMNAV